MVFTSKWGCKLEFWKIDDIMQWIEICVNSPSSCLREGMGKELFSILMASLLHATWEFHNDNLFCRKRELGKAIKLFNLHVDEFLSL